MGGAGLEGVAETSGSPGSATGAGPLAVHISNAGGSAEGEALFSLVQ